MKLFREGSRPIIVVPPDRATYSFNRFVRHDLPRLWPPAETECGFASSRRWEPIRTKLKGAHSTAFIQRHSAALRNVRRLEKVITTQRSRRKRAYMSYREIALVVRDWTEAHSLWLTRGWAAGETLYADLSSADGQSFRIAIDEPLNGVTGIHVVCLEGWTQNDPRRNWVAETHDVRDALEQALAEVLRQMERPFAVVETQQVS